MEDFVTFEIALKLKEKGFKEECIAYYHTDGELLYNRDQYRGGNYKSLLRSYNSLPKNPIGCEQIDAPTISQVLKWLREEKEIYIECFLYDGTYSYFIKSITQICKDDLFHECLNEDTTDEEYTTYEQAALAGVAYCLENLI